ncbi:hypothetical protein F2Q70_00013371 [Brassica cretica]|uniref:Replication factor A C-terminal domain-containing protein n=1 Tax=Brassica cretica TaxID=69181 RepID=A0A8S9M7L4_BRACR|nr:hypothetical protein F2Q70_00013371 [Brassica cretica]
MVFQKGRTSPELKIEEYPILWNSRKLQPYQEKLLQSPVYLKISRNNLLSTGPYLSMRENSNMVLFPEYKKAKEQHKNHNMPRRSDLNQARNTSVVVIESKAKKQMMAVINKLMWLACVLMRSHLHFEEDLNLSKMGDTIQATVNEDVVPIFESFLEEDGTLSPEYLIDIMGQIVEGVKIHASVMKDLVTKFDPFLSQGSSKIFINFSVGHSYGSYGTTKHPYKISFLETTRVRSCESPVEVSGFDPTYRDILDGSLNSDYLVDVIGQIVEVSPIEVEKCIVMCTIAAIDSDMGWYYLTCKVCAKKVLNVPNDFDEDENDDDPIMFTYYCPKCKVSNPKLLPRYKLHLIVLDSTGNSKFLLFDNVAIQLLHQPSTELVGPNADEIEEPAAIPLALNNLIGKTYLFKVGIERENYLYKHDTCIISKIITNHDIITEFQTIVYPKKPSVTYTCDNSILSDAPEGSVMVSYESSQECEPTDLTPVKRRGTLFDNLEAAVDQNSLTRKLQPVNGSNFLCCANFRGIKRGLYHPMYCVDLCGALVRVGDLIATKLAQPDNIYNSILYSLEFSLINLRYTHIQCVAYGALAHRLNAFWRANTADVVVTVLRLWRIEWGEGGFNYVTNMEGGFDILFDSNIPEIQFFKSQIPSIDF